MNIKTIVLLILVIVLGTLVGLIIGTVIIFVFSIMLNPPESDASMAIVIFYAFLLVIGAFLGISFGIFYYKHLRTYFRMGIGAIFGSSIGLLVPWAWIGLLDVLWVLRDPPEELWQILWSNILVIGSVTVIIIIARDAYLKVSR